jgi:uncharacterized membrane protein
LKAEARAVSLTAMFTALVCAFTISIQLYIPATRGYFNVGEVMVYTAALVGGPFVGAFAGGVGSMLADIATGFAYYAPGTLVVKGLEGLIVGWLARQRLFRTPRAWRALSTAIGVAVGLALLSIAPIYVGEASLTLSLLGLWGQELQLVIQPWAWYLAAAITAILIVYAGFRVDPNVGWVALSILLGGGLMVLGYFIYEQVFLGVAAIVEVPFNVAQCLVGLMASIPLYKAIQAAAPSLIEQGTLK